MKEYIAAHLLHCSQLSLRWMSLIQGRELIKIMLKDTMKKFSIVAFSNIQYVSLERSWLTALKLRSTKHNIGTAMKYILYFVPQFRMAVGDSTLYPKVLT